MNAVTKSILLISLGALAACSTLSVHEGTNAVDGVPFYVKSQKTIRTTAYHRPFLEVSFTTSAFDANSDLSDPAKRKLVGSVRKSGIARFLDSPACQAHVEYLQELAVRQSVSFETLAIAMRNPQDAAECIPDFQVVELSTDAGTFLVKNQEETKLVTDMSTKYYINGKSYLFGRGKADFDLSPEMTLTSVKSEVETNIGETLLNLLPINSFLTAKYVTPLSNTGGDSDDAPDDVDDVTTRMGVSGEAQELVSLTARSIQRRTQRTNMPTAHVHELTVSSQTVVFSFSTSSIANASPHRIAFGDTDANLDITWVKPGAAKKKDASDNKSSIVFSGKIDLPKSEEKPDKGAE